MNLNPVAQNTLCMHDKITELFRKPWCIEILEKKKAKEFIWLQTQYGPFIQ